MNSLEGFRFNELPAEIRCMIWIETVSGGRIVGYRNYKLPVALQVNSESRQEALKVLKLLFEPKEKYGTYKLRSRQLLGHERQKLFPTYVNPGVDLLDICFGKGGIPQQPNRLVLKHADVHKVKAVFVYLDFEEIEEWFECMPENISDLQVFSQPAYWEMEEKYMNAALPIAWVVWNRGRPANAPALIQPKFISHSRLYQLLL